MLLAISNAAALGPRRALPGVAGNALGTLVVAGVSITAVGLLFKTSALAFAMLKVGGAVYLAWLGLRQIWKSRASAATRDAATAIGLGATLQQVFMRSLLVALSNPKSILFFTALFPHFMGTGEALMRFVALSTTFAVCAMISHVSYILLAGSFLRRLVGAGYLRHVSGAGGLIMLGMGVSMMFFAIKH